MILSAKYICRDSSDCKEYGYDFYFHFWLIFGLTEPNNCLEWQLQLGGKTFVHILLFIMNNERIRDSSKIHEYPLSLIDSILMRGCYVRLNWKGRGERTKPRINLHYYKGIYEAFPGLIFS